MNDKKLGKYLYFSQIRVSNIKSYMNSDPRYNKKDFSNLFNSETSESDLHYLLGILISNKIKLVNKKDLIDLSHNEASFRKELVKSKSQKILAIFEKYNIKSNNILETSSNEDPRDFNPYSFMRLIIEKKDLDMIEILKKKKLIE